MTRVQAANSPMAHDATLGKLMVALGKAGAGPCDHCESESVHVNWETVSGRDTVVYQCQECLTSWMDTS